MKIYSGCEKVVEVFPGWKICDKPVKVAGPIVRCKDHPMIQIWP